MDPIWDIELEQPRGLFSAHQHELERWGLHPGQLIYGTHDLEAHLRPAYLSVIPCKGKPPYEYEIHNLVEATAMHASLNRDGNNKYQVVMENPLVARHHRWRNFAFSPSEDFLRAYVTGAVPDMSLHRYYWIDHVDVRRS